MSRHAAPQTACPSCKFIGLDACDTICQDRDMTTVVRDLHGTFDLAIEVHPGRDGGYSWKSTLSGDDFLDGPWTDTQTGNSPTAGDALADAGAAWRKKARPWWRTFLFGWIRRIPLQ